MVTRTLKSRRLGAQRGVALLMVVVAIAILAAVAAEFAYNQRVDLTLATHQRDELRAYYLARSGIGMGRLLLRFQRQLDQLPGLPGLSDLLSMLGGGAGGAAAGASAPKPTTLNLRLWAVAKVDCHLLRGMVGDSAEVSDTADASKEKDAPSFGRFRGCFDVQFADEEEKLNLNKLDAPQLEALPVASRALAMFGDKRFEFLYEDEDAHRVRANPQEVLVALRDWIDEDEVQSTVNLTGQGEVFMRGFSDEAGFYSRYEPRYRPKNARFDSLDELYLVNGVNDRWMAAFRDRITVYPDVNARLNINTEDPLLLYLAVLSVTDPTRPDPRLANPVFMEGILRQLRAARSFSFMGLSVADFVMMVETAGVQVDRTLKTNPANNRVIGDKSATFRIQAKGESGDVTKTLTAVVRVNDGLGQLVHYREE